MTSSSENAHPQLSLLPFKSEPKQFIAERDIYHVLLENGDSYIFKPTREERPREEQAAYERFKRLQGKYIPICYGVVVLQGQVGLLLEDCGSKTFENPPEDNENAKFILFLRAMCAMKTCLTAGYVHQDSEFRNIVYDPVTLQVRIFNIKQPQNRMHEPQDLWILMDASISKFFKYELATSGFCWGLFSIINVLMKRPWDLFLYLLVLHYCFYLIKKKRIERLTPSRYAKLVRRKNKQN